MVQTKASIIQKVDPKKKIIRQRLKRKAQKMQKTKMLRGLGKMW